MDRNEWNIKHGLNGMEKMTHKYLWEALSAAAIIVAALSAWKHLFYGNLSWSLLLLVAGSITATFLPWKIDRGIITLYAWGPGKNKTMGLISEGIKIAIALFAPFLYFAWFGLMAGTAIHYYIHHAHSGENKGSKAA